jgi:hypothetical protein
MPGEWSPDELRVLLWLRPELEPCGVKYIDTVDGRSMVHVSDALMPLVRERLVHNKPVDSGRHRVHPGGAHFKEWPRLALEEATRLWLTGAYEGSRNEIAKQVTRKVITEWDDDDLVAHGWVTKPFKFTRDAMDLVVEAVGAGLLDWDAEKGRGVFRKFSATPEWLPIPRRKPAP